jgi:hypothetical protein
MGIAANPRVPLPEFRELIRCARAFIAGQLHFSYVCSAAAAFRGTAKLLPVSREVKQMAEEWAAMATRAWPEMSRISNPISEDEFRQWVSSQISVFQPLEFPNVH